MYRVSFPSGYYSSLLYAKPRERVRRTESRAVIGYPSGQDGAILPARDTGFVPQVHRSCFGVLSHVINPLLTKLARSMWLDIGLVLFFVFIKAGLKNGQLIPFEREKN